MIKLSDIENDLYDIKGTTSDKVQIMFVDFQYGQMSARSTSPQMATISPNVFTKHTSIDNKIIFPYKPSVEMIRKELDSQFAKVVSSLGSSRREKDIEFAKKFDIDVNSMRRTGMAPERGIIAKINGGSNYLATEGRIGPAQYIISNSKTYSYLVKYLSGMNFLFKNNVLWIGNIKWVVDNSVEDNFILLGRKNKVDQPGVHCLILTDENNDVLFQELWDENLFNKKYLMHYKIVDLGFHPETQYLKIDTKDIAYYRNLKLLKIEEIYGKDGLQKINNDE